MDLELGPRPTEGLIAQGGEGVVYHLPDRVHVAKEYHDPGRVDFARIRRLIEVRACVSAAQRRWLDEFAAWPLCCLTREGRDVGIAMKQLPDRFNLEVSHGRIACELQHLIVEGFLERNRWYCPNVAERVQLVGALASGLSIFHSLGVIVGDISMKNLLWALRPTPSVFFLDVDSFTVVGCSDRPAIAETPDWRSPPELNAPSIDSDNYKLALVAQRVLEERPAAKLNPDRVAVPGDSELESAIRVLVTAARSLNPCEARRWAVACGHEDPLLSVPGRPGDWIDDALLAGDWDRAIRLAGSLCIDWPRLDIARRHLAAWNPPPLADEVG